MQPKHLDSRFRGNDKTETIMQKQRFVISLGGSIIVPDTIDAQYVKKFIEFIKKEIKRGNEFIIVIGGGKTARAYIDGLKKSIPAKNEDLDWMGIYATWLNAQFLTLAFEPHISAAVSFDPTEKLSAKSPLIISAGWKPGWSTDYVAVQFAATYKCKSVINLSNIDYVYDRDPRKFKNAKKLESISWKDYRKMVGNSWDPGASYAFDPIAAKLAEKDRISVSIANGKDLKNLKSIVDGKKFKGTIIK